MQTYSEHRKSLLEADKKPYNLVILSHDQGDDSNDTGELVKKVASTMGIKTFLGEFRGLYEENGTLNSFPVVDGKTIYPTPKSVGRGESQYEKPFPISPENTIIMARGVGRPGLSGNHSWYDKCKKWEHEGYTLINGTQCHDLCSNKVMTQIIFERENINTPKTVLIAHAEDTERALKELGSKFPIILKTGTGTNGIGVILVESAASLQSIVQLLYRESEFQDILLQEYIKADYDVRVIVFKDEVIGVMKRPVVSGDFRSNVSQGSKPKPHKLTDFEKSESIRAAQAVDGTIVGVDFIPGKKPYFIEVNNVPGLVGIEEALQGSIVEKLLNKLKEMK
jgi:ribosomal protein S6--L-glutamate ligase|tara:strand:- start:573 stop:1583 length:1011 start_codon:yes stop_codon:yes gene_type:complete